MAKFKITFTASREMTPEEIREQYGDALELEEDSDPVEALVEHMNDNGTDFFSDEDMQQWDHTVDAKKEKAK
jgi:hypothetical protein